MMLMMPGAGGGGVVDMQWQVKKECRPSPSSSAPAQLAPGL